MADFLFEIGLEEVPARMIAGAQAELEQRVVKMLERERLVQSGAVAKSFATPRRLAVWLKGVAEQQEDVAEELVGPSVKVAYKDGVATPAAVAFAKKAGVQVGALKTITNAKGEYLAATSVKAGRGAAEVIAAEMPKELAGIYWAKNMYWRAGRPERFVRPVRWMVAMLGEKTVPVEFGGYVAGSVTYGHRVLFGEQAIVLKAPGEYEDALLGGFVVADVEVRRQRIRKALDHVTRTVPGLRWREDHELVDKLTQLTEWPTALLGGFEKEYLALPEEVLVTVMRDHQNYFAVETGSPKTGDGKLAPYFLAVLNTEADEAGVAVIRHGNERVLRARFNDARFFWEFDQRVPLIERVALLEHVTFQKDLGSYAAKAERVRELCKRLVGKIEGRGFAVDTNALLDAASLAKTDLTTELVKEFTELQGEVGGLYARAQGIRPAACDAIYDQYRPVSMEDRIPRTAEGQLLAIADKADTIAGMFGLGLEPTGSKDPFALRRAANGIVKILGESSVELGLGEISRAAVGGDEELVRKIEVFFAERLEFYLREAKGQAYDVVKAVLAIEANDVRDAVARAEAVTAVRGSEDFAAVSSAFKRMKNILAQAREKGIAASARVDIALLTEPAEKALAEKSAELAAKVKWLRAEKSYKAALEEIATLRPQVDAFFEAVMVMAPDEAVRANRLALLEKVLGDFSGIADFSEIVIAG
ncbi:glycine--tRNA ligase subunit beta [Tunturibacter empetritectus]|uniref:Glycine--tRNA ligase beta subunit n=1 Tax=Tunturiibacter lichenicola TaxID=2051959 RepID=A0A7W8J4Z3_9BACT|nr:glycine--tRNA ligase subunit beta [Edaphobacter lichenicola]MBB5342656.1 glycyl-tRNA synthetase beta chain [Edaphobacter lichenicola]